MAKSTKKTAKSTSSNKSLARDASKPSAGSKIQHAAKKNKLLGVRSNAGRFAPAKSSKNTRNEERREALDAEDSMEAVYANFTTDKSVGHVKNDARLVCSREETARAVDEAVEAFAVFGTA